MYIYNAPIDVPRQGPVTKALKQQETARREALLSAPLMGYNVQWKTVEGVEGLSIEGMENFVAAPVTGKRSSAWFSMIDLANRTELCQVKKSEVSAWLIATARSLDLPMIVL